MTPQTVTNRNRLTKEQVLEAIQTPAIPKPGKRKSARERRLEHIGGMFTDAISKKKPSTPVKSPHNGNLGLSTGAEIGKKPITPKKAHKYGAIRTVCNAGHSHPSKGESARCDELHIMERGKAISDLKIQDSVSLVGIGYKPDFSYMESGPLRVYEDFKGPMTDRFRLICKLWSLHGTGILRVVKMGHNRCYVAKEIQGPKLS